MVYSNNFVADSITQGKAYPALAMWKAMPYTPEWRQFVQHWPNTVPVELYEHFNTHNIEYNLYDFTNYRTHSYYTIGIGFFNFDVDYFKLMNHNTLDELKAGRIKALFYYHEGDNPYHIKSHLDTLCIKHNIDSHCFKLISGNTRADYIKNCIYFPDHELLYWHRNRKIPATPIHTNRRPHDFTVLSRTHKWWRATVMTDLHKAGLLENCLWSYRTDVALDEPVTDNPIEIDTLDIREVITHFLNNGPYTCDTLTTDQQNDHHITETAHYTDSYCNIVLETHFDADGSGGAFLTEKTFKPIKHGQPFIIVGCPGSLAALRKLGYKTFDHAIDNSYDDIQDNTQRWLAVKSAVSKLKSQDLHTWFESCRHDVEHNQQLFCSTKANRLNTLLERLHND
jgi:hypothetical protein